MLRTDNSELEIGRQSTKHSSPLIATRTHKHTILRFNETTKIPSLIHYTKRFAQESWKRLKFSLLRWHTQLSPFTVYGTLGMTDCAAAFQMRHRRRRKGPRHKNAT